MSEREINIDRNNPGRLQRHGQREKMNRWKKRNERWIKRLIVI